MNTRKVLMYILILILAYILFSGAAFRPRAQADANQSSIRGISIVSP
jgi:hypothetical protein